MRIDIPEEQVPEDLADETIRALITVAEHRDRPETDRLKMEVIPRDDGSFNVVVGPVGEVRTVEG